MDLVNPLPSPSHDSREALAAGAPAFPSTPTPAAPWRGRYEVAQARVAQSSPAWLASLRQHASASLVATGFPSRSWEEWRYTDPEPVLAADYEVGAPSAPGPSTELSPELCAEIDALRLPAAGIELVMVDGCFQPALSRGLDRLPEHVTLVSLASVLSAPPTVLREYLGSLVTLERAPLAALNTALFEEGVFLHVRRSPAASDTIHLLFFGHAEGREHHLRNLFVLEPSAEATVVETWASADASRSLHHVVSECVLGVNANLRHHVWQRLAPTSAWIGTSGVRQARDSRYQHQGLWLGASFSRQELRTQLREAGASTALEGIYLGRGAQHIDNHTWIEHEAPHCQSVERYKGVLDDASHGVFRGVVHVHPGAVKTDSQQANHTLLLSPRAEIDSKPQLEIYNDDVRCAHGSTVGQLQEEERFYLRSRGIPDADASKLLALAFVSDVVERVVDPSLREHSLALVRAALDEASSMEGVDAGGVSV